MSIRGTVNSCLDDRNNAGTLVQVCRVLEAVVGAVVGAAVTAAVPDLTATSAWPALRNLLDEELFNLGKRKALWERCQRGGRKIKCLFTYPSARGEKRSVQRVQPTLKGLLVWSSLAIRVWSRIVDIVAVDC